MAQCAQENALWSDTVVMGTAHFGSYHRAVFLVRIGDVGDDGILKYPALINFELT